MFVEDELDRIATLLANRGVKLRDPATSIELNVLSARFNAMIPPSSLSIYRKFDGFERTDQKSMIDIWSTDRIVTERDLYRSEEFYRVLPIGDFLIDSHIYVLPLFFADPPVRIWGERDDVVAKTFLTFLNDIALGNFDFM